VENKRETEAFAASQAGFAHPRRTARPYGVASANRPSSPALRMPGKKEWDVGFDSEPPDRS
jgi:hypothetical protein